MKRAFFVLFVLVALLAPVAVFAAENEGGYIQLPPCTACGRCGFEDFLQLFVNLYHFGLEITGPLAVLYAIVGGVILLTASGYENRYKLGRDILSQVVAGLIVVLMSWVIVDTTVFLLTGKEERTVFGQPWYQGFTYEETGGPVCQGQPTPAPTSLGSCSDLESLAFRNHTPYPAQNANTLDDLITCVTTRITSGIDMNQIYTWGGQVSTATAYDDHRYYSLNFTQGERECQSCPTGQCHAVGSCHYAPEYSGGAMAVDFNASNPDAERTLCRQLYTLTAVSGGACAGFVGTFRFEDDHTHITANGCRDSVQIDCDGRRY